MYFPSGEIAERRTLPSDATLRASDLAKAVWADARRVHKKTAATVKPSNRIKPAAAKTANGIPATLPGTPRFTSGEELFIAGFSVLASGAAETAPDPFPFRLVAEKDNSGPPPASIT